MPDLKYDDAEAQFIINAYAEKLQPSQRAIQEAALELMAEFIPLMEAAGFTHCVQPGTNNLEFASAHGVATVMLVRGGLSVAGSDGAASRVRLEWDRMAGKLRSTERDTFLVPVPGEPFAYRSALAELAQATISKLQQPPWQA